MKHLILALGMVLGLASTAHAVEAADQISGVYTFKYKNMNVLTYTYIFVPLHIQTVKILGMCEKENEYWDEDAETWGYYTVPYYAGYIDDKNPKKSYVTISPWDDENGTIDVNTSFRVNGLTFNASFSVAEMPSSTPAGMSNEKKEGLINNVYVSGTNVDGGANGAVEVTREKTPLMVDIKTLSSTCNGTGGWLPDPRG